jgi:excisionase family DNA binding protein
MSALIRGMEETTSTSRQGNELADEGGELDTGEVVGPMLLTIPQAARVLAIGRTSVYELIGSGSLEVVRIGRSVRVPVEALESFVTDKRSSH